MSTQSKHLRIGATAAIALFVLFGVLYAWWWSELATRAKDEVNRWVRHHNESGGQASTGAIAVSGFPLRVHMTFADPKVAWSNGWSWQAPPLSADIAPWMPNEVRLSAPGRHLFAHADAQYAVEVKQAAAIVSFDAKGTQKVALRGDGANFAGMVAEHFEVTVTPLADAAPGVSASLVMRNLSLPEGVPSPLGRGPASMALDLSVKGALGLPVTATSLDAWRGGGGTLEINRMAFDWAPLSLTGNATAALDRDLQPEASGTVVARGLLETFDKLAAAGEMRPKDAATAKIVLSILGKTTTDGTMQWSVPVTIQNSTLYLGPAAIAALPRLEW